MKNIYLLTALLLGFVFNQAVYAADLKIGTVNAQLISQKLPQSKTMMSNLQNEFKERLEKLQKMDADIRELQAKGQKEAPTMTTSALTALKRDIEKKVSELKLADSNMKEDLQKRQQEESLKLNRNIGQALEVLAKRDNFDLILYRQSIVFSSDAIIDITEDVVKMMTDPKSN